MATFGKDFVRSATQPAYLQGLFTAAQQIGAAPGRRRVQEQLASATPLERFDLAIAQLTRAGDLEKAAKLTATKDKYVADQQARTETQITSVVASQMLSSGSTEVPESITYGGQEVAIPPRLSSDILEVVNTLQSARDARELAVTSGELLPDYAAYIKDNPQLLEQAPMLSKTYDRITSDEPGMLRTEKINAVKSLITLVDNDRKQRREAKTGEKALAVEVENLMEKIRSTGSRTWMWMGNDMADFLEDAEDDEIKLFKEQAVLKLQQNPRATEQEVIDYGMSGMREKISGQKRSGDIAAREAAEAAEDEALITLTMSLENLSREEAIERLKKDSLMQALFGVGQAIATEGNLSITGGN